MKHYFEDYEKLGKPIWFDETGHPRFCRFSPDKTYTIYAEEVTLLKITCQNCGMEFLVTMNWPNRHHKKLSEQISNKSIHYGDPPNTGCCLSGCSMTCTVIEVMEFWELNESTGHEWIRNPKFEVVLPDGEPNSDEEYHEEY